MRREFYENNRTNKELVQRMWLLLKVGANGIKAESYGHFAKEKLGIAPSSLSRKLTNRDRFFNGFEVEVFKDLFGEDAMNVEDFDLTYNGTLVRIIKEDSEINSEINID